MAEEVVIRVCDKALIAALEHIDLLKQLLQAERARSARYRSALEDIRQMTLYGGAPRPSRRADEALAEEEADA